jgi:hypothetical protein
MDRLSRDYISGYADILRLHTIGVVVADTKRGAYDQTSIVGALTTVLSLYQSQEYSDKLSHRVSMALARIKRDGGHVGRVPFGYRRTNRGGVPVLVVDASQAAVVRRIYREHRAGASTLQIARGLTGDKAGGKRWWPNSVQTILANPVYAGYRPRAAQAEPLVPADHRPIIDAASWAAAQTAKPGAPRSRRAAPFSGMVWCASCGSQFIIGSVRRGQRVYRCRSRHLDPGACDNSTCLEERRLESIARAWAS